MHPVTTIVFIFCLCHFEVYIQANTSVQKDLVISETPLSGDQFCAFLALEGGCLDQPYFGKFREGIKVALRDYTGYQRSFMLRQQVKQILQNGGYTKDGGLDKELEAFNKNLYKSTFDPILSDEISVKFENFVQRLGLSSQAAASTFFFPKEDFEKVLQSPAGKERAKNLLKLLKSKIEGNYGAEHEIVDAFKDFIVFLDLYLSNDHFNANKEKFLEDSKTNDSLAANSLRQKAEDQVQSNTSDELKNIQNQPLASKDAPKPNEQLGILRGLTKSSTNRSSMLFPKSLPVRKLAPSSSSSNLKDAYDLLVVSIGESKTSERKKLALKGLLLHISQPSTKIPPSFPFTCIKDGLFDSIIFEALLQRPDFSLDHRNKDGLNILMYAAQQGNLQAFKTFYAATKKAAPLELFGVDNDGLSLLFHLYDAHNDASNEKDRAEWLSIIELLLVEPLPSVNVKKSEGVLGLIEKIPSRKYLNNLKKRTEGKTVTFDDPATPILESLAAKKGFQDVSDFSDPEMEILAKYPVFLRYKGRRNIKVKASIESDGFIKWSNFLKIDPISGVVYKSINFIFVDFEDSEKAQIEFFGCILVLPTRLTKNDDGITWNVHYMEQVDWKLFQTRIRLYDKSISQADLNPFTGPFLSDVPIFVQKSVPKMLQVPVLARYDLPETDAQNHYIYLSVDEFRKRHDSQGNIVDSDHPDGKIACVWIVAGGPGGRVQTMHKMVEHLAQSILQGSKEYDEVRVLFIEHRGIGHMDRLTIAQRLQGKSATQVEDAEDEKKQEAIDPAWEFSRLLEDASVLPVDQYGSTAAANDIVSVVQKYSKSLQQEVVHIGMGGSYGSRTMQKATKLNPALFHTVIMFGASSKIVARRFSKECSGILKAMIMHPLYEDFRKSKTNDEFIRTVMTALDNLDNQTTSCKIEWNQHQSPKQSISQMLLQRSRSSLRKDLMLLFALYFDRCPEDKPLNQSQINAFFRVFDEHKPTATDSSSMKRYGKMLLNMIENWERYNPSPQAFLDAHCNDKKESFSQKFFFSKICAGAKAISAQRAALLPKVIYNADYKSIDSPTNLQSAKKSRVIILQGAIDMNTESFLAESTAEELRTAGFGVEFVFFPLKGHDYFRDEVGLVLQNLNRDLDTIFTDYLQFPESQKLSYHQWYKPPRDLNILKVLLKFDIEALEVLLKVSNNIPYFEQVFKSEEGLIEKYKNWLSATTIENIQDYPLTLKLFNQLGIVVQKI